MYYFQNIDNDGLNRPMNPIGGYPGPWHGGQPGQGGMPWHGGHPGQGGMPWHGGHPGQGGMPWHGGHPGQGGMPWHGGQPGQGGMPGGGSPRPEEFAEMNITEETNHPEANPYPVPTYLNNMY